MDAIIDLSWRVYPAFALMVIGAALAFYGTRRLLRAVRAARLDPSENQNYMRGFRIGVIGLTLIGLGVSWNWHVLWLFVLALVFFGEEFMESTIHLSIISRKPKELRPTAVRVNEESTG